MPARPCRARNMGREDRLRAHDPKRLVARWRSLAPKAGLDCSVYSEAEGFPLITLVSRDPRAGAPSLYLSAGIHGDEAAATEALAEWAESRLDLLRGLNATIFPCLNPWGLANNCRLDARGRDLNRSFGEKAPRAISAQKRLLAGKRFDAALCLHEDFDAHGVYIYEVGGKFPHWGEDLLAAAARHVPRENRRNVEGRACKNGLIRATRIPSVFYVTMPEALYLRAFAPKIFTLETPSEFSMNDRVEAHLAALDALAAKL